MRRWYIVGVLILLFLTTGCLKTSEGKATDVVYQIQQEGVFWKTWDVWLMNDHPTEHYSAIYCPEPNNSELIKRLKTAVEAKQKCIISHHSELIVAPWRCNSDTLIDDIDCAKNVDTKE